VRTIFRCKTLGSLYRKSTPLHRPMKEEGKLTFVTAPLDALYHTSPGRGRLAPVEEMLIIDPPHPCSIKRGRTIFPAK
jgi:hypothetical protein